MEFEQFKLENPDVAKYFLIDENDEQEDIDPIANLNVPPVNELAPIYDHWEKAAQRMLQNLSRNS